MYFNLQGYIHVVTQTVTLLGLSFLGNIFKLSGDSTSIKAPLNEQKEKKQLSWGL